MQDERQREGNEQEVYQPTLGKRNFEKRPNKFNKDGDSNKRQRVSSEPEKNGWDDKPKEEAPAKDWNNFKEDEITYTNGW